MRGPGPGPNGSGSRLRAPDPEAGSEFRFEVLGAPTSPCPWRSSQIENFGPYKRALSLAKFADRELRGVQVGFAPAEVDGSRTSGCVLVIPGEVRRSRTSGRTSGICPWRSSQIENFGAYKWDLPPPKFADRELRGVQGGVVPAEAQIAAFEGGHLLVAHLDVSGSEGDDAAVGIRGDARRSRRCDV